MIPLIMHAHRGADVKIFEKAPEDVPQIMSRKAAFQKECLINFVLFFMIWKIFLYAGFGEGFSPFSFHLVRVNLVSAFFTILMVGGYYLNFIAYYTVDSPERTAAFNKKVLELRSDKYRSQLKNYVNHSNFTSRESTDAEMHALRQVKVLDDAEADKARLQQEFKAS